MSDVQRIKTAVGKNDAPAVALVFGESLAQHITSHDFGGGLAHHLGGSSGGFATNGVEKLSARDGSRAALHDYQAAGDVGDVRGFERRCPAGERQSVGSKNGVSGPGDVHCLIAAVNGDVREAIAWLEKSRAVPSAGDQERLQFHLRESRAACARKLLRVLADVRVMLGFKLGFVWRGGTDARLLGAMQPITSDEGH